MPSNKLAAILAAPLNIGNRRIASRLVLAPMAGLGHVALRGLIREYGGAGLLFTGMCGAPAIAANQRLSALGFHWHPEELDSLVCQLFGNDAAIMARAAARIEQLGFFGVDINFGCCATTICRRNLGAALLKTPDQAVRIVAAVRRAISIPLFVKFRTGWQNDITAAEALAQRFAAAGADALTFHPRVAPDRRSRKAVRRHIGNTNAAVAIPVFGNGDVFAAGDCLDMLETTGCDGVALGRLAAARPWSFAQWQDRFQPDGHIYLDCARSMLARLTDDFEPVSALRHFSKWAAYFAANFHFGHQFFAATRHLSDRQAAAEAIDRFFAADPAILSRPNLNLLR